MNKYSIIFLACFISFASFAQRGSKENREKIEAFKRAHITEALSLTKAEAEKFWPIYNASEDRIGEIKHRKSRALHNKMREAGGIDSMSDAEADSMLTAFAEIDLKFAQEKKKLYKDLKGIISAKKTLKLIRAEQGFGRELLKKFRAERKEKNKE